MIVSRYVQGARRGTIFIPNVPSSHNQSIDLLVSRCPLAEEGGKRTAEASGDVQQVLRV
jgi:hypothetical protein